MKTNILVTAASLSDQDLLARLEVLASKEREASAELVAHLAELAPRPDLPSAVRKLPCPKTASPPSIPPSVGPALAIEQVTPDPAVKTSVPSATPRPIVRASAPERYGVQFTIGPETHEKLRRLQALLRREIPDGDPGAIFDRALTVLLEKVEKTKLGAAAKPRSNRLIRPETDKIRRPPVTSRHVPQQVKRAVWKRDGGQCALVSPTGHRCTERTFLEFHHIQPYALQGPATVDNISLRCWRHNQYEAELIFGNTGASIVREECASP